jgi:hypothetical protein
MKKPKFLSKLIILALAGAMAVSVTACGESTVEEDTTSTVVSTVSESSVDLTDAASIMENLQTPENMAATMKMELGASVGSANVMNMEIEGDVTVLGKEKIRVIMTGTVNGETVTSTEQYIVSDGDNYTAYVSSNGTWAVSTIDAETYEAQVNSASGEGFATDLSNLKISDETGNASNIVVLEGEIPMDDLQSQLSSILGDLSDSEAVVPVKLYVNTDTMEVQSMSIDLQSVIEALVANSTGDDESSVTITAGSMEFVINETGDDVADFTVPDEALAAASTASDAE